MQCRQLRSGCHPPGTVVCDHDGKLPAAGAIGLDALHPDRGAGEHQWTRRESCVCLAGSALELAQAREIERQQREMQAQYRR